MIVDMDKYGLWSFRTVITQEAVAGGDVVLDIKLPGGAIIIVDGGTGSDVYATGRQTYVQVVDEDGNAFYVRGIASANNQPYPIVVKGVPQTDIVSTMGGVGAVILADRDTLRVVASSLAQNETFTVAVRAIVKRGFKVPDVDITNSGGTVSQVQSMNRYQ